MQHWPNDDGMLDAIPSKTMKTICGKRISWQSAEDIEHIDCPECRDKLRDRIKDILILLEHHNLKSAAQQTYSFYLEVLQK